MVTENLTKKNEPLFVKSSADVVEDRDKVGLKVAEAKVVVPVKEKVAVVVDRAVVRVKAKVVLNAPAVLNEVFAEDYCFRATKT
jgi:hypothetical protein